MARVRRREGWTAVGRRGTSQQDEAVDRMLPGDLKADRGTQRMSDQEAGFVPQVGADVLEPTLDAVHFKVRKREGARIQAVLREERQERLPPTGVAAHTMDQQGGRGSA